MVAFIPVIVRLYPPLLGMENEVSPIIKLTE